MHGYQPTPIPLNEKGLPLAKRLSNGRTRMIDYRPLPIKILSVAWIIVSFPFAVVITVWRERKEFQEMLASAKQEFKMRNWNDAKRSAWEKAENKKWQAQQTPEYRKLMGWDAEGKDI